MIKTSGDGKQIIEGTCSNPKPPLKSCLQLGFDILRLHSYKVPLVKGEIFTVQHLKMVRKTLVESSAVERVCVWQKEKKE